MEGAALANVRARAHAFDMVVTHESHAVAYASARGVLREQYIAMVEPDYFPMLGVVPQLGRFFTANDEATRAVQIDSNYDMAHHVLGAWNAEVKRLSGFQRFFAKALFGGGFMDTA